MWTTILSPTMPPVLDKLPQELCVFLPATPPNDHKRVSNPPPHAHVHIATGVCIQIVYSLVSRALSMDAAISAGAHASYVL